MKSKDRIEELFHSQEMKEKDCHLQSWLATSLAKGWTLVGQL